MPERIKTNKIITEKPLLLTVSCFVSFFINSLLIIACFISLFSLPFLKKFIHGIIKPEQEVLFQCGIGVLCLIFIISLFSTIKILQLKLSGFIVFITTNIFLLSVLLIAINSKYTMEFHFWMTGIIIYLLIAFSLFLRRFH